MINLLKVTISVFANPCLEVKWKIGCIHSNYNLWVWLLSITFLAFWNLCISSSISDLWHTCGCWWKIDMPKRKKCLMISPCLMWYFQNGAVIVGDMTLGGSIYCSCCRGAGQSTIDVEFSCGDNHVTHQVISYTHCHCDHEACGMSSS